MSVQGGIFLPRKDASIVVVSYEHSELENKVNVPVKRHKNSPSRDKNITSKVYVKLIYVHKQYIVSQEYIYFYQSDIIHRKKDIEKNGPVKENGVWMIRTNQELMNLYSERDIISEIRKGRLRWLGHVQTESEERTVKKVFKNTPQGKSMLESHETDG